MVKMEDHRLKKKINKVFDSAFHYFICSSFLFLILGYADVYMRNRSLDEKYNWFKQVLNENEMKIRHRRNVKLDVQDSLKLLNDRLDVFDKRLNRTDAFERFVQTPFAALLPYLRGPIGLPGVDGKKGQPGESGAMGRNGKIGPKGLKGDMYHHLRSDTGSNTYVRWGRRDCPNVNDTELVYTGITAGQSHEHTGGMSNTLCLHSQPSFGKYSDSVDTSQYIYGTEYQIDGFNPFGKTLYNHDAPCAVCRATKQGAHMMIPGRSICPKGWKSEYKGYLMSSHYGHKGRNTAICVDMDAESFPRSNADKNGNLLYTIQASCGSLPCGPYVHGRELTCVVCTK